MILIVALRAQKRRQQEQQNAGNHPGDEPR
jgi:hypothetical protein